MNPTTQPSDGAVRAAKLILGAYGINGDADISMAATAIDQQTGAGELVALADGLIRVYNAEGTNSVHDFLPLVKQARAALSRHTSTQGKEGKL